MTDDEVKSLRQRAELFASKSIDNMTLRTSDVLELCDDVEDARDVGLSNEVACHDAEDEVRDLKAQVESLKKELSLALEEVERFEAHYLFETQAR